TPPPRCSFRLPGRSAAPHPVADAPRIPRLVARPIQNLLENDVPNLSGHPSRPNKVDPPLLPKCTPASPTRPGSLVVLRDSLFDTDNHRCAPKSARPSGHPGITRVHFRQPPGWNA